MSADNNRTQQMAGQRRPPQQQPRPAGPPPPQLSAKAQEQESFANKLFEKNGVEWSQPTDTTPALVHSSELDELRRRYTLASARLDALTKLRSGRLDYYLLHKTGEQPFDPLTPAQIEDAKNFFAKYGMRLRNEPRQAPPNPIKEREQQAQAAAQPGKPVDRAAGASPVAPPAAQAPAPHAPEPAPSPAETPLPAGLRGITPPPPARLDLRFLTAEGFEGTLQLVAPTGVQVLEAGAAARRKLVAQGAKPVPTAEVHLHQSAAPASASAASDDDTPQCAIHKTPMERRQGKNGSFWSCPKKLDDGSWCPYKPAK